MVGRWECKGQISVRRGLLFEIVLSSMLLSSPAPLFLSVQGTSLFFLSFIFNFLLSGRHAPEYISNLMSECAHCDRNQKVEMTIRKLKCVNPSRCHRPESWHDALLSKRTLALQSGGPDKARFLFLPSGRFYNVFI